MTQQGAERAVVVSALVVAATYTYRLITEGHASKGGSLIGVGAPPNVGRFITGWGFAFLVISIITEAAPPLGGSLAILVAAGDVLANADQVAADVNAKLAAGQPGPSAPAVRLPDAPHAGAAPAAPGPASTTGTRPT